MLVAILVGLMISVVVGVTMIPTILSSLPSDNITDEAGKTTGTSALIDILPFVFIAIVLLGLVMWMGRGLGESGYEKPIRFDDSDESTKSTLSKSKQRGFLRSFLIGVGNVVTWPITRKGKV